MSTTHDDFGWRDRAIALASLGAAGLSRLAFTTADVIDEKPLHPLEMQVLVALALHDSLAADPPHLTGLNWLSRALRLEQWVVEEIVGSLERANLVRRSSNAQGVGEIEYEFAEKSDEDLVADELPVAVTELGLQIVEGWLRSDLLARVVVWRACRLTNRRGRPIGRATFAAIRREPGRRWKAITCVRTRPNGRFRSTGTRPVKAGASPWISARRSSSTGGTLAPASAVLRTG